MNAQLSRQSFLGDHSSEFFRTVPVAIVGASGGGSPIAQQLAHIGFGNVHVIDPAIAGEQHRHRLMGVSTAAIVEKKKKVHVVKELMDSVNPAGSVIAHPHRWQDAPELLTDRKIVFTAVDGYEARDDLERFLRSWGIPMFDIGMDVHQFEAGYQITGQVIASIPGQLCMRCFGFITDARLKSEAGNYGAAGVRAQVSWPNAILAATAVSMAIAHLLPWHSTLRFAPYLQYDGNTMQVLPNPRLQALTGTTCPHYKT